MKKLFTLVFALGLAISALAQQKPVYERTRQDQVLSDRATWSRNFMAIPSGPTPYIPSYVPDSLKCKGVLFYKTSTPGKGLYVYECFTDTWVLLNSSTEIDQKINDLKTADNVWSGINTFTGQFIAGQTMFNNVTGIGQLNNNIQFDLGNGFRAINGSVISFSNSDNTYKHYFREIGTSLYLINNDNNSAIHFTNNGNIIDDNGKYFLKQGSSGSDTSVSNNYLRKTDSTAFARKVGSSNIVQNSYTMPYQATVTTPAANYGKLSLNSLGSLVVNKANGHTRTWASTYPGATTFYPAYKAVTHAADSADVATKYNSKLFLLASDYLKGDSATDNTIAARQMYTLAKQQKKMVWFDEGNYIFTDTVWVKVATWGDGGKAPFNGTTGVTGNGLYKKGKSVLIQTTPNKGLLYVNEHGIPIQGLTIKYTGSANPTSGNGLEINKGYSATVNNNYFEGFYANLYVASAVDAFFFNNQFVNPIKYNFYLGGDITDEGCNGVYQNMFNSSKSAIAEQFHADVPAGLRLHDNEFHIATGQAGPNYSKYAIYLNCIGSTSEPNVHHNGIEAYTEAGTYITVADTTVNLSKIMYNGNQSTSYSPNARDFVVISPGNIPHINGVTAVGNFFGNTGPRAAVYMKNVDLITMNSNTYANGTTAYRDSLVNCTRVFTRVAGDFRLNKGFKYLGGEENDSKITFQSSTSNTVPSTTTAFEFFGGNGVNLATVTQGNMWGFGTNTPKSTASIAGGVGIGTFAGSTAIAAGNVAASGRFSASTTLVGGIYNSASTSGTDILRSYLNVDGTLYHSIRGNFSATATGSYFDFLVNTGAANTQLNVLRLFGTGTVRFPTYTSAGILTNNTSGDIISTLALPSNTTATTQTAGTNNTTVATTAFVQAALSSYLRLTASGTGSATTISIAHGLTGITSTSKVFVTAKNSASAGWQYVTTDATNVNIVYTTAPVSGTNNLSYDVEIKP